VAAPWTLPPGALTAGLHLEYTSDPLVQYVQDGEVVRTDALVRHALGARLSLGWVTDDRLSLAADLPVRFTLAGEERAEGPALGDAGLWAIIGVVEPGEAQRGFALAVAPYLRFPTGAREKYAGAGVIRGGVHATARLRHPGWALTAETGIGSEPAVPSLELSGGPAGRAGLAATWLPRPEVGLGLEARTWVPLTDQMRVERGTPAEVLATLRAGHPGGPWILGGASRSLANGVGMGTWGAFVGVGTTLGASREAPVADPAILVVTDPDGQPVRGALVSVEASVLGTTNAWGRIQLDPPLPRQPLSLTATGLRTTEVAVSKPGERPVTLPWAPVELTLRVVDQAGAPVDAQVEMHGPAQIEHGQVDPGEFHYVLEPGTWAMDVSAPGMGGQSRTVVVPKRRSDPLALEVVLVAEKGDAALALLVTDPEGRPVEGAVVLLNGTPVGTTSTGGDLAISGLAAADHRVKVRSELLEGDQEREISLPAAETANVGVSLGYAPGTVRLVARGPDGAVVDGLVRVRGPTTLPPMPLGEDGERLVILPPGRWVALVSSPELGMQERTIEVTEHSPIPLLVEYTLQPYQPGDAELIVRVQDRTGAPLDGVDVLVDNRPHGRTASGGALRLRDLSPGPHVLKVRRDGLQRPDDVHLDLVPGVTEVPVVLDWEPGTLRVTATSAKGVRVDALVRLAGPAQIGPVPLGARGEHVFYGLEPGRWEVLVSVPEYGMQARVVDISEDSGMLASVDVVLQAQYAAGSILEVVVTGPDGNPVPDAFVLVDGRLMGLTSTGGQVGLWGVPVGTRRVEARRGDLRCAPRRVAVSPAGSVRASLGCEWAPGAVLVTVHTAAGPVDDALLRVSGPRGLPPVPVERGGTRTIALEPGQWRILVSSPTAGLAEQVVEIEPDDDGFRQVDFLLDPHPTGASLLVRLADSRGAPVGGATVRVDGLAAGITAADGSLLVSGLTPGAIVLDVEAPGFEQREPVSRLLDAGAQEQLLELTWRPIPVPVRVEDEGGEPLEARIDAVGPEVIRPVSVAGEGQILLPPGTWRLVASVGGYGSRGREVEVLPEQTLDVVRFSMRPAMVELVADKLELKDVHFALDADTAGPEYVGILEEVAGICLANPWILKLEIQGHTDASGTLEHNMSLSERRAISVQRVLVELGLPPDRLVARGYGPLRAIGDNATPAGRAANRRVEFHITEAFPSPDSEGVVTP